MTRAQELFGELVRIMERLRAPGGCPWDRAQTHQSIKAYLIEEAYEVAEAIDEGNADELRKELGDVLLQVVFHAQMAREAGTFTLEDVIAHINEKMVRRHPHVFGSATADTPDEVLRNWARIKAEERKAEASDRSVLAGVPRALPALQRAHRLGEKAAHVGFDWADARAVLSKVHEELSELEAALHSESHDRAAQELGDLLFALASLARHLRLHAEDVLQRASDRFIARFRCVEEMLAARGIDAHTASPELWDQLWEEAKQLEAAKDSGFVGKLEPQGNEHPKPR
ncbi:Nucleoside triphosphate pyrophosphohydrolase/pyrophosphatase MazG [bacterium HR30]|nr:Nucleoside triphosphate pyrophosphohydrolase/pyrophosphatase MazG [bacterium HR30]